MQETSKKINRKKHIFSIIFIILIVLVMINISFIVALLIDKPKIEIDSTLKATIEYGEKYKSSNARATALFGLDISNEIEIENLVDDNKIGEYTEDYCVKNLFDINEKCITKVVDVVDTTAPSIVLNGDSEITINKGSDYKEQGVTAIDAYDGDISNQVEIIGSVDTTKNGEYLLTYKIKDSSGNESETTRKIIVKTATFEKPKPVAVEPTYTDDTYITISIEEQTLRLYKNNKLFLSTPVITGTQGKFDSEKGEFKIYDKVRNTYLVGPGYKCFVSYWMAFNKDNGMHDATWASVFGGEIYKVKGSHGCINMPFEAAKTVYENAAVGTRVTVY